MDTNYSYNSYPESGGSSPRSREIDFDNPPPWEDQSNNTNYKVKLMCSYGGKIHPRPHDNQLAYIGGETKILAVDRSIKFNALLSKLSAITDAEVSFKYQLPGEDLDALISVTNDDDLDHMMNEYDRLNRASPKPARLRIFLFPVPVHNPVISPANSFSSIEGRSDRDRFVEALNTGPGPVPVQSSTPAVLPVYGNADFLNIAPVPGPVPVPVPVQVSVPAQAPVTKVREFLDADPDGTDRIQKHIHDLRQLRIAEDQQQQQQQQMMYRRQSEDSMTSGYGGDYYRQTEKVVTTALPGSVPAPVSGYQMSGGFTGSGGVGDQQPVYMVPASGGVYHAPMARPVTGPIGPGHGHGNGHGHGQVHGQGQGQQGQGYYAVYNGMQPVQQQMAQQQQQQQQLQKVVTHSEGIRMVQSTVGMTDQGYGQVAYDNGAGRHVYYTPQGAMVAPHQQQPQPQQMQQPPQLQPQPQQMQQATHQYQAMGGGLGTLSQDAKVIAPTKNSQG